MDVDKTDTSLCETLSVDQLKGSLAESWEVSDDFTTMTVKLRQGVNFADKTAVGIDAKYDIYGGRALTAADVKYSYDRVLGLDGVEKVVMDQTDWAGSLYMVDSVEAPDDQTVIFHFNTNNEVQVNNFMITVLNICGPEWDQLTDEQKNAYIDKIIFNTRRLSDLVGNILLLSKVNNQTISPKTSTFRLDEQVRQSILALESKWENKEIEFDIDLDEIEYTGFENLLSHVWLNLIDNAVK